VIRHSNSPENPAVTQWTGDRPGADNLAFFEAAIHDLDGGPGGNAGIALIGLVGQCDLPGVTLRRAQSVLRWDRRPSLWSHAFLIVDALGDGADVGATRIREVALQPRTGAFPEPACNAVTDATLAHYASPVIDANVALLKVRMSADDAERVGKAATAGVNRERLRYDLFSTLGSWQSYLWTRGTANPLEEGIPMFNAALVEFCFEAIGLDLTPGASERNSAPEHIWNAARWWDGEFAHFRKPISGRYLIRDPHCGVLDPEEIDAARYRA
jgi:hypothetical protein